MEIRRDRYLQQIIDYRCDGQVKVIIGILLISICSVCIRTSDNAELSIRRRRHDSSIIQKPDTTARHKLTAVSGYSFCE